MGADTVGRAGRDLGYRQLLMSGRLRVPSSKKAQDLAARGEEREEDEEEEEAEEQEEEEEEEEEEEDDEPFAPTVQKMPKKSTKSKSGADPAPNDEPLALTFDTIKIDALLSPNFG